MHTSVACTAMMMCGKHMTCASNLRVTCCRSVQQGCVEANGNAHVLSWQLSYPHTATVFFSGTQGCLCAPFQSHSCLLPGQNALLTVTALYGHHWPHMDAWEERLTSQWSRIRCQNCHLPSDTLGNGSQCIPWKAHSVVCNAESCARR